MFVVIPPGIVAAVTQTTAGAKRGGDSQRAQLRAVGRGRGWVARRGNRSGPATAPGQPGQVASPGRAIGPTGGGARLGATVRATAPRTVAVMLTFGSLGHARDRGGQPAVTVRGSGVVAAARPAVGTFVGTFVGTDRACVGTFVGTPPLDPARMNAHVVNVDGTGAGGFRDIAGRRTAGAGRDGDRDDSGTRSGGPSVALTGMTATTARRLSSRSSHLAGERFGSRAGERLGETLMVIVAAMTDGGWWR